MSWGFPAAPICMISYQMQGGCICENAPLLRLEATSVDIASLFVERVDVTSQH